MDKATPKALYKKTIKTILYLIIIAVFPVVKPAFCIDIQMIAERLSTITGQSVKKIVVKDFLNEDAYAHPMGYVVITRGMIDLFREDEAALAFIIGHELAHIAEGHYYYDSGTELLGISRNIYQEKLQKEIDADLYSLKIIEAAGYNPAASMRVLDRLRVNHTGQASYYMEKRINSLLSALGGRN